MKQFTFLMLQHQPLTLGSHEIPLFVDAFFPFVSFSKETREHGGEKRVEASRLGLPYPFRSRIIRHSWTQRDAGEGEETRSSLFLAFSSLFLSSVISNRRNCRSVSARVLVLKGACSNGRLLLFRIFLIRRLTTRGAPKD